MRGLPAIVGVIHSPVVQGELTLVRGAQASQGREGGNAGAAGHNPLAESRWL